MVAYIVEMEIGHSYRALISGPVGLKSNTLMISKWRKLMADVVRPHQGGNLHVLGRTVIGPSNAEPMRFVILKLIPSMNPCGDVGFASMILCQTMIMTSINRNAETTCTHISKDRISPNIANGATAGMPHALLKVRFWV